MPREPRSGICRTCGAGWCCASQGSPAEYCACTEPKGDEPDPLADEGQSDARELARDR